MHRDDSFFPSHIKDLFKMNELFKNDPSLETTQVSVFFYNALIDHNHFLYLSSFMDKYFSGNAFKFLVFFNLLTFNKRVLNLAGSLARSESHLLCVVIGCSPLMSHIHVHALH